MSEPKKTQWMIYGANGYTGALAAERAKMLGERPVLAGRNAQAIEALGKRLDLPTRVFSVTDRTGTIAALADVSAVLHCAGPFSATAMPMLDACIAAKTHYLDITGEVTVFEDVYAAHDRLVAAGVVAVPGVGFDVVPTDCLAAMLKEKLPGADLLRLAWRSSHAKLSPGTAKTMIEGLPGGALVRRDGVLIAVAPGSLVEDFPFSETRSGPAVILGLGDVSSAYRSTGIANIEGYIGLPKAQIKSMRMGPSAQRFLAHKGVQRVLKSAADRFIKGPSEADRNNARMQVVGEARQGLRRVIMRMTTPEGYAFTAEAAVAATLRVAKGEVKPGAYAPSTAFGAQFVEHLSGVKIETISA